MKNKLIIAVDFDGTIVEHMYPFIGRERTGALKTLKKLKDDGHRLILWTCRSGIPLADAVNFCTESGVTFDAINDNIKGINFETSRKIYYDVLIDDRNLEWDNTAWDTIYKQIKKISSN